MDSYISIELIAKLREQQRTLRGKLDALETSAMHAGKHTETGGLVEQCRCFAALYQAHERLVGALLEAVEPDNPLPRAHAMR